MFFTFYHTEKVKNKINLVKVKLFLSGLSSMLEALAIYVGVRLGSGFSLVQGLEKFFEEIIALRSAKIVFSREAMHGYQCKTFYGNSDIPPSVREQEPLLLDPNNPCNNRLEGLGSEFFDLMKIKAKRSLDFLKDNKKRKKTIRRRAFIIVMKILCPGPFKLGSATNPSLILRPSVAVSNASYG